MLRDMKVSPIKPCKFCSKFFSKPDVESREAWLHRRKYCSISCTDKAPRTKETRLKQRKAKLGKSTWNKGTKGVMKPNKTSFKKGHTSWVKGLKGYMAGEKNPNWKGGVTSEHERIRKSPEYKEWRKSVFERDNYTCKNCGKRGGDMQADHIKPFAMHPRLRMELENGRTLCVDCHRKTDTYGVSRQLIN